MASLVPLGTLSGLSSSLIKYVPCARCYSVSVLLSDTAIVLSLFLQKKKLGLRDVK